MKLLITGSNGFIGSSLIKYLVENKKDNQIAKNISIRCLIRKTSNLQYLKDIIYRVETVYGDLTQIETLENVVKDIDIVVHCAATIRCIENKTFYDSNYIGTRNLVNALKKYNDRCFSFIHLSSQAAIGPVLKEGIINSSEHCQPVSHYGRSKLLSEKILQENFNKKNKLIILRPAATYGPYDKDMFLFFKYAQYGFLPIFNKKFTVQFTYIKDLIEIITEIIFSISDIDAGIYFVAEDRCYNIFELKKIFSNIVKRNVKIIKIPYFASYIFALINQSYYKYILKKPAVFNLDKLSELKYENWTCQNSNIKKYLASFKYTELSQGLLETYNWYKENKWL